VFLNFDIVVMGGCACVWIRDFACVLAILIMYRCDSCFRRCFYAKLLYASELVLGRSCLVRALVAVIRFFFYVLFCVVRRFPTLFVFVQFCCCCLC
jgi:hypothetical protein